MSHTSLSRITKFNGCKFQYFGNYILNIRQKETPVYFAFGNAIDFFLCTALGQANPDLESLHQQTIDTFDKKLDYMYNTDEFNMKKNALLSALNIAKRDVYPKLVGKVKGSQVEFDVDVLNIQVKGIIDLEMKSGDWLIDIKTAGRMWPKYKELSELQAKLYPLYLFSKDKNLKEVTFEYWIITSASIPKFQIRTVYITREMSEQFLYWIKYNQDLLDMCTEKYEKTKDPRVFPCNRASLFCYRSKCDLWELCEKTFLGKVRD